MTYEQAQQMIAIMYSQDAEINAIGQISGRIHTYDVIICILILVLIFFLALKRN